MTSGILRAAQARRHVALIERHLTFPDGVRLMNRPMDYHGGTSRYFRRAESAASFGREVGLQYAHAHIRYVEAMARIGRPDEAFRGLLAVCPIGLDLAVPSALPRQANAYFSSSDAAFLDRRQASRRFGRLRTGRVGMRGGWRVYSSGPGIFVNQLISNVLGLRTHYDDAVFDPVLPGRADGLTFDVEHDGRSVRYLFYVAGAGFSPREVRVNGRPLPGGRYQDNPYRAACSSHGGPSPRRSGRQRTSSRSSSDAAAAPAGTPARERRAARHVIGRTSVEWPVRRDARSLLMVGRWPTSTLGSLPRRGRCRDPRPVDARRVESGRLHLRGR